LGVAAAERRELLGEDLHRYTPNTLATHDELDRTVEQVRIQGYATEVEELALGRACIAAPILDRTGSVVAGISISGPLSAMDLERREDELSRRVIEVADSISIGLGYLGPVHSPAGRS
jgi:DNA-binding IclR family transcriptional regulator